ncbi:MAG: DUF6776 family protein [Thiohalomonadaceae bacterium]
MSHLVVRARPLWQQWLIRIGGGLGLVLLAWGLFEFGRYQGGFRLLDSLAMEAQLHEQLASLGRDNIELREQTAILRRSNEIDREAYRQLEGTVNGLQDELMELKRELDFYRGIVSPSDATRGLEVQRFELQAQSGEVIRYNLVLTQVLDNSTVVQGTVEFRIEGNENGEAKTYTLAQLSDQPGELAFRYRYFQSFEGELRMPEGFVAQRVHLHIKPRGRTHKPFSQSFDWLVRES